MNIPYNVKRLWTRKRALAHRIFFLLFFSFSEAHQRIAVSCETKGMETLKMLKNSASSSLNVGERLLRGRTLRCIRLDIIACTSHNHEKQIFGIAGVPSVRGPPARRRACGAAARARQEAFAPMCWCCIGQLKNPPCWLRDRWW